MKNSAEATVDPASTITQKNRTKTGPPVKRLIWPGIVFVAFMTQIPFLLTIYLSFQKWNLLRPDLGMVFNGLSNFVSIVTKGSFLLVLRNTLFLTMGSLILCLIFGVAFALLLNRRFFARGLVRTLFISPFFVMPTVAGIVWKTMVLNPSFGLNSWLADVFGQQAVGWLSQHPLLSIMMIVVWQWAPFFMLVLLAGLQSLPDDQLEAAEIDGASPMQKLINVVLPHLMRYFEIVIMLGIMFILQIFGQIYVTTTGGPGYASTNLTFLTFREGFQNWEVGQASAVGVVAVIFTIFIMLILFFVLRRRFKEELS